MTAVEFLLEKYKSQNTLLFAEDFEQAKEMEKEQKIDFASYYTPLTKEELEIGFKHKFKNKNNM